MSIKFTFLPHGESILVESSDFNFLIDGGNSDPFFVLEGIRGKIPRVDGILVTHIDQDHILGIIQLLGKEHYESHIKNIKFIAFNEPSGSNLFEPPSTSKNTSKKQGNTLKSVIEKFNIDHKKYIHTDDPNSFKFLNFFSQDLKIDLLSPDKKNLDKLLQQWKKENYKKSKLTSSSIMKTLKIDDLASSNMTDQSIPNGSSLSFLITYKNKKFLLLGDAHIEQVVLSLRKKYNLSKEKTMEVDFVKLSHHGSKKNINSDFLDIITSNRYIICKPSINYTKLPDGETIAKIVKHRNRKKESEIIFYFNTEFDKNIKFTKNDHERYKFSFKLCDLYDFSFKG